MRAFLLISIALFLSCSDEIEFQEEWRDLSCTADEECGGAVLNDVCDGLCPSDIPLHQRHLEQYRSAYDDAATFCFTLPERELDSQPCPEQFSCTDGTCKVTYGL
jgi:hypothetical protein